MNRKIIFLHPHFLKPGGDSRVVLEFAKGLGKKGLDVRIVTIDTCDEVIKDYKELNIIRLKGPSTGSIFFWLGFPFFIIRLKKILDGIDNKILFSHSLAIYWGAFYKRLSVNAISGYYFHDLGMPFSDSSAELSSLSIIFRIIGRITKPFFYLLNNFSIKNADFLIANSKTSADFIIKKYNRKVDLIAPPGIDPDIFRPGTEKDNYIYSLGRLEKIKNIDIIINSFALYASKYKDSSLKLKIIGEGIEKESLKSLAKDAGMSRRVEFLGRKTPKEICDVAQKAKIGIFMCPHESFGLAAIESMACGTPVLGVNQGGISETVIDKQTGLLSNLDENEISEKMKILLDNADYLIRLSGNSYENAKRYSWDKTILLLRNFFQSFKV